jgi:hypothetical protein
MKTFLKLVIISAISMSPLAAAAQQIEATATTEGVSGAQDSRLVGSLWLTYQGQIKVKWEGVQVSGGKVELPTHGSGFTASLPNLTLDLQQLLGARWMDSIQLQVQPGSYDNDPLRGTTDIQIGAISLSLSQKVVADSAWTWTLKESVNTSAKFQRTFHETGYVFNAVPVSLAIDTQVVRRFTHGLAASVAIGIYGSVIKNLAGGDAFHGRGGYVNPELSFKKWAGGARVERNELAGSGAKMNDRNVTGYVRYALGKIGGRDQSLSLSLTSFKDGIIARADGTPRKGRKMNLQYNIRF